MTTSITIALGKEEYVISLNGDTVVTGPDAATSTMITRAVNRVRSEYSPAFGGVASFIATELETDIKAKILNVSEIEAVQNAVY